jgi:hypothetical protein
MISNFIETHDQEYCKKMYIVWQKDITAKELKVVGFSPFREEISLVKRKED